MFAQKSFFATDELIIGFLNACSLRKHAIDIDIDAELNKCHVLGIAETWLYENEEISLQQFSSSTFVSGGPGKGVAAYTKEEHFENVVKVIEPTFSFISSDFHFKINNEELNLRVIFVYLSSKANYQEFKIRIRSLLTRDLPTIIMGDMNFHYSEEQHSVKDYLEDCYGFKQIVQEATNDKAGHILDQVYVHPPNLVTEDDLELKPLYFSDHDAICVKIRGRNTIG